MKKLLLVFGLLLCGFVYGQNNKSAGSVVFNPLILPASNTIDN
jgi:hypothetical protein